MGTRSVMSDPLTDFTETVTFYEQILHLLIKIGSSCCCCVNFAVKYCRVITVLLHQLTRQKKIAFLIQQG